MRIPTRIRAAALGGLLASALAWSPVAPAAAESPGDQAPAGPVAGGVRLGDAPAAPEGDAFFTQDPSTLDPNAPRRRKAGDGGHGEELRTRGDLLREGFRLLLK